MIGIHFEPFFIILSHNLNEEKFYLNYRNKKIYSMISTFEFLEILQKDDITKNNKDHTNSIHSRIIDTININMEKKLDSLKSF